MSATFATITRLLRGIKFMAPSPVWGHANVTRRGECKIALYQNCSDNELSELTDEEKAEVKPEVPVAVLDGFKVKIRNIFGRYFE